MPHPPPRPDTVYAVGIGPGNPAYLTSIGNQIISDADVIIGFTTVLEYIRDTTTATLISCTYETEQARLATFAEAVETGASGAAVLMGDPNVSGAQFLEKIDAAISSPLHIIPGSSLIQIAASRTRIPLEESTIVTLHKRGPLEPEPARLVQDVRSRHLIILPRPFDWMLPTIADHLSSHGVDADRAVHVYERLTHATETTTTTTLGDLAKERTDRDDYDDLSLLAIPHIAPETPTLK